jgi:hypothetical protein
MCFGAHHPGRNAVHPDAGPQFEGKAAGKRLNGGIHGPEGNAVQTGAAAEDARKQHHRAAFADVFLGAHPYAELLSAETGLIADALDVPPDVVDLLLAMWLDWQAPRPMGPASVSLWLRQPDGRG